MRYYEVLYIVNPNYEQERLEDVMKEVDEKVAGYKFNVINHRVWGKKRLAYPIEKHKYGIYVLLQFETESLDRLVNFERFVELHKVIMRNQTVRLNERPEVYTEDAATDEKPEEVKVNAATEKTVAEPTVEEVAKTDPQEDETSAVEKSEAVEKEISEKAVEEQPEEVQE